MSKRIRQKIISAILAIICSTLLLGQLVSMSAATAESNTDTADTSYLETLTRQTAVDADFPVAYENSFSYDIGSVLIEESASYTFDVNVEKAGGYHIAFDYFIPGQQLQNLEVSVQINGVFQFTDSKNMKLPAVWEDKVDDSGEIKIDRYRNQVYPMSERKHVWQYRILNSSLYHLKTPLVFELKEGTNTITISNNEVAFQLGRVHFLGEQEFTSYSDYLQGISSKQHSTSTASEPITIEGESYFEKSESHIRGERSKNYNLYPYSAADTLINSLSETMWQAPGESVTYQFEIKSEGIYYIALKYIQSVKYDMPVYKNIYVDGKPLTEALLDYSFEFTNSSPKNHVLNQDGEPIPFYFDVGVHTLTLESTSSLFFEANESVLNILRRMNDLTMDIVMVTGGKTDRNRDWNIEEYIPDIKDHLLTLSSDIMNTYEKLCVLSGKGGTDVAALANLKVVSDDIYKYTVDKGNKRGLDNLINNLEHFSQGVGSMTEMVSVIINDLLDQPMGIDQITITQAPDNLPKATVSIFKALYEECNKLITSFTSNADTGFNTEKTKLNIWINRPVTHIEVLREMVSSDFAQNSDIEVNLSAMPDESKLMLSIVAGDAPDAVLGLSMGLPFDLGLRGALHNLREFDDFGKSMTDFTAEMYVPFVVEDACYGVPETANFFVLFYRTDIIDKLGISIPKDWDDLIKILPVLDRYGMNVQTIISGADVYKHFGCTVPFIQQFEGSLYNGDGSKVAFDDPKTLEAFTLMTDLYTKYNMPTRIVNFYNNFKSGVTPLGISELSNYILLKNAAPEIFGQWGIAPNIGRYTEDGSFINSQPDVASSCVIVEQSNKKEEAWEFIKWWMSSDTQYRYGVDLQGRFGKEFVWNTANLDTLSKYTYFTKEEKEVIIDQIRAAQEIPRHPAYFQVEREMSNAWTNVVLGRYSVREALDRGALSANRVIANKLKEFGYMSEDGQMLKPFISSTIDQIRAWKEE